MAPHVSCNRAPEDRELVLIDPIYNEEITHVNMFRSLAAWGFSVFLKKDRTFVVLIQNIVLDFLSLSLHEIRCPAYRWHEVIRSNNLGLR